MLRRSCTVLVLGSMYELISLYHTPRDGGRGDIIMSMLKNQDSEKLTELPNYACNYTTRPVRIRAKTSIFTLRFVLGNKMSPFSLSSVAW